MRTRTLLPREALPMGLESIGVGSEFYDALRAGSLVTKRARILSFTAADKLGLDNGEQLPADLVVFATGWRQDISFLDASLRDRIRADHQFQLYRHILPPSQQRLGFVGYASSIACQFTSEIAAHWLSQHFRGELNLPGEAQMNQEIAMVHKWETEVFPGRNDGYFLGPYVGHYVDQLLADMGLTTRRGGNFLSGYFGRLLPSRCRNVAKERQDAR